MLAVSSQPIVPAESPQGTTLFKAAFPRPESKEGSAFFTALRLPSKGNPQGFQMQCRCNIIMAKVILEICQETAEDILNGNYSHFDALVRNFGCQVTALQNHRILCREGMRESAIGVHKIASERIKKAEAMWEKPPTGDNKMEIFDYLAKKEVDLDIRLSSEMAQLVRFKILNIINFNELYRGRERPKTNTDDLHRRVNDMGRSFTSRVQYGTPKAGCYTQWIAGLQAEEAETSVAFIQKVGNELTGPRSEFIQRMLKDVFKRSSKVRGTSSTPIVSLPQLYTGEASLKGLKGIVLVKNKMKLCGNVIAEAKAVQVFVLMPEHKILTQKEIMEVPGNKPVIVFEGYVPIGTPLEEKVRNLGVMTLLNTTLASLPQYASGTPGDFEEEIGDPEAQKDIEEFKKSGALEVIELDHIYCASMNEERALQAKFSPKEKP